MGGQSAVLGLAAASLFLSMCVLFYGMLGFSHEAGAELPSAMTAARGAAEFGLAPGVFALLTYYGCMEHVLDPSLGAGLAHSILLQSGRRFDFSG